MFSNVYIPTALTGVSPGATGVSLIDPTVFPILIQLIVFPGLFALPIAPGYFGVPGMWIDPS
jgi:hypothetical protein